MYSSNHTFKGMHYYFREAQLLTNMNEVSGPIQHEVTVVPVFDLEEEAQHTVAGHAHNEISPRLQHQYMYM